MEHDFEEDSMVRAEGKKRSKIVLMASSISDLNDSTGDLAKYHNALSNQISMAAKRQTTPSQ